MLKNRNRKYNLLTRKGMSNHNRDLETEKIYRTIISILSVLAIIILWVLITC